MVLDLEVRSSDHIPTYLKIECLTGYESSTAVLSTDWCNYKTNMEDCCHAGSSNNKAMKGTLESTTQSLWKSSVRTDFDTELEKLRAIHRRAERR